MSESAIVVSAVVLRDERGRVLTVRKQGTRRFQFPGGKPDPGESPAQCAVREVAEETGLVIAANALRSLGVFVAEAGNESGRLVRADVFEHPLPGQPTLNGEIAELAWVDPCRPSGVVLAPLLALEVFPALAAAGESRQRDAVVRDN